MNKLLTTLLAVFLFMACSSPGDDNTPAPAKFEIKRLDLSIGSMDTGIREYLTGPIHDPVFITSEETRRGHLRIFTHIYNELPIAFQHLTVHYTRIAEEMNEHTHPFDPNLAALSDENTERWTTGWEIFVVSGKLKAGDYTLCNWIEAPNGTLSNVVCFDIVVVGDGELPPEQIDFERLD